LELTSEIIYRSIVTIHGLFEIGFRFVVLACKKQVLISNKACEAGTPHTIPFPCPGPGEGCSSMETAWKNPFRGRRGWHEDQDYETG
jgi:hypothetical protein